MIFAGFPYIFAGFSPCFCCMFPMVFPLPRPGGGRDDLVGPQLGILLPTGATHELHALFARRTPTFPGQKNIAKKIWHDMAWPRRLCVFFWWIDHQSKNRESLFLMGKINYKWCISIAILVYQRVTMGNFRKEDAGKSESDFRWIHSIDWFIIVFPIKVAIFRHNHIPYDLSTSPWISQKNTILSGFLISLMFVENVIPKQIDTEIHHYF